MKTLRNLLTILLLFLIILLNSCNVIDQPSTTLLAMEMEWEKITIEPNGLFWGPISQVYDVKRDSEGNFWAVIGQLRGVIKFDPQFRLLEYYYFQPDDYDTYRLDAIAISPDNDIYLSFYENIYRLDKVNKKLIKLDGFRRTLVHSISFSGSRIFVTGAYDTSRGKMMIRYSDDKGETWQDIPGISDKHQCSCYFEMDNNMSVAIISGSVYLSSDHGNSWSLTLSGINPIYKVLGMDNYLFAIDGGILKRSDNYGMDWESTDIDCESIFCEKGLIFAATAYTRDFSDWIEVESEEMGLKYSANFGKDWFAIKVASLRRNSSLFLDNESYLIIHNNEGFWKSKTPLPTSY